MSGSRLRDIPGFNIDRVAAAAGDNLDVRHMESLDTDIPPPPAAIAAIRRALGEDAANSWFPYTGCDDLKEAVAAYIERRGPGTTTKRAIVTTCGKGEAILDRTALADRHARFVFSNGPVERLTMLGARVRGALASARAAT